MPKSHADRRIVTASVMQAFNVPAERVFEAWIRPEHIRVWFAPGLGEVTEVVVNPAVGGSFSITQRREDGEVAHIGRYQQVVHPRRLIFSWTVEGDEGEDRVIVDITPKPAGCEVALHYELDAEWAEFVEDSKLAWSVMLAAMARHLDASA